MVITAKPKKYHLLDCKQSKAIKGPPKKRMAKKINAIIKKNNSHPEGSGKKFLLAYNGTEIKFVSSKTNRLFNNFIFFLMSGEQYKID